MANEENLKPFPKGVSGNPKGRPKKLITHTIEELKKMGVKETTAQEIKTIYLMLINLSIPDLEKLVKDDENQPVLTRVIGRAILSKKGFDIIEKILDRGIGRPQQPFEISSDKPIEISFKE